MTYTIEKVTTLIGARRYGCLLYTSEAADE